MKHSSAQRDLVPDALLAEAGVWLVRLHGPGRTREAEAGFRRWLHSTPSHARAFELATEVWEDSQNLGRVAHRRPIPTARTMGWRVGWTIPAMAAALTIAITATFLYLRDPVVTTGIGEQRALTLEDGSRVFLNTATHLTVQYDKQHRHIRLDSGEAMFDVAKHSKWPFTVYVGDQQVRALGTSFAVRRDPERITVTLVDGKVAVTPIDRSTSTVRSQTPPAGKTLNPGERLTYIKHSSPTLDRPILDNTMAWRRGQVYLKDTPLSEAAKEMNRYSKIKLVVQHPQAGELLINGLFQTGDSMSLARAVAQTYGLNVVEQSREILLSGTPAVTAR